MSPPNPALSFQRIGGMVLRYLYLTRRSWPRLLDLVYWPVVQMILWGLVTRFFVTHSSWLVEAAGVLIAAVLLWDVLFRGQLGVSVSFMEELYSRNLGHLFVSPLRPYELVCALVTMSVVRTVIGMSTAALLAILLYHYSIFSMGLPLIAFFTSLLVMGWAVGLIICGLLLRYGLGAESMAWVAIFAIQPISGIYYPISTLPEPLQVLAYLLPSSYVFEGMRAVLVDGVFRTDLIVNAVALNAAWLLAGALTFLASLRAARRKGLILQIGE